MPDMTTIKTWLGLLPVLLLGLCARTAPSAAKAGDDAKVLLIWGGGKSPADADRSIEHFAGFLPRLSEQGLLLADGFPKKLTSADHAGLNPGFHIAVLGVCHPQEARALLKGLRPFHPGLYFRRLVDSKLPYACPRLQRPGPKPKKRPLRDDDLRHYCDGLLSTVPPPARDEVPQLPGPIVPDPARDIDESFHAVLTGLCTGHDPESRSAVASVQAFGPGACFEIRASVFRSGYRETITFGLPDRAHYTRIYCISRPGKKTQTAHYLISSKEFVFDLSLPRGGPEDQFCQKRWDKHEGSFQQVQRGERSLLCIEALNEYKEKSRHALVAGPKGFRPRKSWPRACR